MFRQLWLVAILTAGFGFGGPAWADDSPVKSATLQRVGFGGQFKVGEWTPLTVAVESTAACRLRLEVEVSDPEGQRAIWPADYELSAAGRHRLSLLFQPGRLETTLRPRLIVRNVDGDQEWTVPVAAGVGPAAQLMQTALPHSVLLVGALGNPGGLGEEIENKAGDELPESMIPIRVATLSGPEELVVSDAEGPESTFDNATGLKSLDTIVIAGQYQMTSEQSKALRTWVMLGGHLVLSIGKDVKSYEESPLAGWLSGDAESHPPFRLTGETMFRNLSALENFAGKTADPIPIDLQNPVPGVKIEPGQDAETKISVLSGPLVIRSPYGFGTVTVIGLSLADEPIQSWPSLTEAMRELLWDVRLPTVTVAKAAGSQLAYSGITEFATQLHSALQTFRPVDRLSTWAIIGLMAVYLLVIGPVDYFVVNQLFGRPRLTWLTFPLLVAVAAVAGVWISRSHNGEELLVSQVNVLDYDASTETLRSRSWVSIYSPETRRYQVSLEPDGLVRGSIADNSNPPQVRMSWFGIPETTFGGMYREGGQSLLPPQYRFSPGGKRIENLPISIWGAKALKGEWCDQGGAWVEAHLEFPKGSPKQMRGTIRHNFPVPITDWFLAYNTVVFLPRTNLATGEADPFPPGTPWPPNDPKWQRVDQREISGYLTRAVAKQFQRKGETNNKIDAIRMEQEPYDPLAEGNPDPLGDIVRMLTFHRQVGGKQYTGLDNYALGDMDLSGRLGLKRAVLYGRLDIPGTALHIKDHEPRESRRATFIRIVLPVEEIPVESSTPLPLGQP